MEAESQAQMLHKVRGTVDVALDLISRALETCRRDGSGDIAATHLVGGLSHAAFELELVADQLESALRDRVPAA